MMWVAMWCAAVLASSAAAPAQENLALPSLDLSQIDNTAPDDEGISYANLPQIGARYDSNAPWLYLLADMPHDSQGPDSSGVRRSRPKRKMPSLSINNPMEVLRQRLLLEVARKQMREISQRQAVANRVFLQNVGKRGFWANSAQSRYDN